MGFGRIQVIWFVIIIILAAAFGPISRMVPTPRERRLTALRLKARTSGLIVEIRRLAYANPKPEHRVSSGGKLRDASRDCAAYSLILENNPREIPGWLLLRFDGEQASVAFSPVSGWKLDKYLTLPAVFWLEVEQILGTLPKDSLAVEVEAGKVTCYWLESGSIDDVDQDIETLLHCLQKLKSLIVDEPVRD